jgi:nicotinate phosphoribosyltransferase
MSVFDGKRLPSSIFKLDVERMRAGWYSDKYFYNIEALLADLARAGYRFGGKSRDLEPLGLDLSAVDVGNIEVEMQWFTRRKPMSIVVGVDKAIAMLRECTGYFDERGRFHNTFEQLEVQAVQDGAVVHYDGDPRRVEPVLKVRGRYRDFALLETPTLGALTRGSRIATNVYNVLVAARGKSVLFFPARFDAHEVQAADGYAYQVAVQLFNRTYTHALDSFISTDAQGDWWGGYGGGTVAHAAIASFLGDTVETMLAFAEYRPVGIPRIALVDFDNDCVGTTLEVMRALFARFRELTDAGKTDEAEKYRLYGVRPDTSGSVRDVSLEPLGDPKLDNGVNPRLVFQMRRAMDRAWQDWGLPQDWHQRAEAWCRAVKIVVSGGFTPKKIELFEQVGTPVDIYAVGSALFSNSDEAGTVNDYTADIVRVKVLGEWRDLAKIGRRACDNPALEPVR